MAIITNPLPAVDAPYGSKQWEDQLRNQYGAQLQLQRTSYQDPAALNIERQALGQRKFEFLNSQEFLTAPYAAKMMQAKTGLLKALIGGMNPYQMRQRYQDTLGVLQGRYGKAMGMLQGYGNEAMAQIGRSFDYQGRQALQQLHNTGLANSTIAPTIMAGYERRKQEAMNQLREQLAGLGLQTHLQGSGDIAGYMERQQFSPQMVAQLG